MKFRKLTLFLRDLRTTILNNLRGLLKFHGAHGAPYEILGLGYYSRQGAKVREEKKPFFRQR